MSAVQRTIHLLPASEVGCVGTPVAVCGELVISEPDNEEDPSYCPECVHAAVRWCAQPGATLAEGTAQ